MGLKIRAAPAIRPRREREPEIAVEEPPEPPQPRRTPWGLWIVLTVLVVAAWVVLRDPAPDPHLVKAQTMLAKYESANPPEQRDYAHPVYEMALRELALVDPKSRSAQEAAALSESIRARIAGSSESEDHE